jgi:hypothetical protein
MSFNAKMLFKAVQRLPEATCKIKHEGRDAAKRHVVLSFESGAKKRDY